MDEFGQGYKAYKNNEGLNIYWSEEKKKGWQAAENTDIQDQIEERECREQSYKEARTTLRFLD